MKCVLLHFMLSVDIAQESIPLLFVLQANQMYNCGSAVAVDSPSYIQATTGECYSGCGRRNGEPNCNFKARYRESLFTEDDPKGIPFTWMCEKEGDFLY